jgi:hypothetical protein
LYDAPDRIPKGWPGCGECILSIARLNNSEDKYLKVFTRDEDGAPVNISGQNMTKGAHNGKPRSGKRLLLLQSHHLKRKDDDRLPRQPWDKRAREKLETKGVFLFPACRAG